MKILLTVIVFLAMPLAAQVNKEVHLQAGTTLTDRVNAAQTGCNATDTCFIVFRRVIPKYTNESLPAVCTGCTWIDQRVVAPVPAGDVTSGVLAVDRWTPLTTEGDIAFRNSTTTTRLPRGTDGQCLTSNATTVLWGSCATGSGITSLGGQTGSTQTFSKTDDTNVTLAITSATNNHGFALGWTGTLAAARLNANVVQAITNDTNVTGSISAQNLTLAWSGTLAAGRGGTGNAFFAVSGPTTSVKTFTLPDASTTILTTNAAVTVGQGGTGAGTAADARTNLGVPAIIASGTAALGTSSIAAGACATVVTVSATGVATTDVITWTPNADISAVTGYTPAGTLRIYPYPTADNANFKVCNGHATDAVTPGAVTLNWRVVR